MTACTARSGSNDTPERRGACENVAEGTYGGLSLGFTPRRERVAADGVREVLEAHLFHVSLVDEPAYQEARVLAVRAAEDALSTELAELIGRDWSTIWPGGTQRLGACFQPARRAG